MTGRDLEIAISTPASIEQVKDAISSTLRRTFDARENDNFGGKYFRSAQESTEAEAEEIIVYRNMDLVENGPYYPEFARSAVIVRFEESAPTVTEVIELLADRFRANTQSLTGESEPVTGLAIAQTYLEFGQPAGTPFDDATAIDGSGSARSQDSAP